MAHSKGHLRILWICHVISRMGHMGQMVMGIWPRFRVFGFRQLPFGCAFAEHDTITPHNSSVLSLGYLSSHER